MFNAMPLPRWVLPQLSKLVEKAPTGPQWVHGPIGGICRVTEGLG